MWVMIFYFKGEKGIQCRKFKEFIDVREFMYKHFGKLNIQSIRWEE